MCFENFVTRFFSFVWRTNSWSRLCPRPLHRGEGIERTHGGYAMKGGVNMEKTPPTKFPVRVLVFYLEPKISLSNIKTTITEGHL